MNLSCQTSDCDCDSNKKSLKKQITENRLSDLISFGDNKDDEDINWIVENSVNRDLKEINDEGILRVLMIYSSTSYFIYKGEPMGFEYELVNQLADHLGLKLELIVTNDLDHEFEVLNRGDVDLIAHGMTVTNERKWEVDFTEYLYLTRQVLVQKMPDNYQNMKWGAVQRELIHDPIELINDTVSIRRNSAYSERMRSLSNEIGGTIHIDTLESSLTTDEIIKMIKNGEAKYTIADENIAKINAAYHPILKVDVPVSFSQRIAWVTRKKSPALREAVNQWILSERKQTDYNVTYNKYFRNKRNFQTRAGNDFYNLQKRQISEYDELIKRSAANIGWDWRLLASQVCQESRFNPNAKSWVGARGLMQIMPNTAKLMNVKEVTNPKQSLEGGTKYLQWISDRIKDVPDSLTQIKFVLAAYNYGLGHVQDAQQLAEENDLNPLKWEENVAPMLLALSLPENFNKASIKHGYVRGEEPVNYVDEIFDRYKQYQQFITD